MNVCDKKSLIGLSRFYPLEEGFLLKKGVEVLKTVSGKELIAFDRGRVMSWRITQMEETYSVLRGYMNNTYGRLNIGLKR